MTSPLLVPCAADAALVERLILDLARALGEPPERTRLRYAVAAPDPDLTDPPTT